MLDLQSTWSFIAAHPILHVLRFLLFGRLACFAFVHFAMLNRPSTLWELLTERDDLQFQSFDLSDGAVLFHF